MNKCGWGRARTVQPERRQLGICTSELPTPRARMDRGCRQGKPRAGWRQREFIAMTLGPGRLDATPGAHIPHRA